MLKYLGDYLDEACMRIAEDSGTDGHDNWAFLLRGEQEYSSLEKKYGKEIAEIVIFYKEGIEEEDGEL